MKLRSRLPILAAMKLLLLNVAIAPSLAQDSLPVDRRLWRWLSIGMPSS